jgi:L-ascorbate metabolism protein UlaG (beta-lactamase superfamily)
MTAKTPLALTLLNGDSSWLVELDGTRLLLDPWLEGTAIVVFPAIHEATRATAAVSLAEVGPVDALVLSHPFPDHCNRPTLLQLPPDLPTFAPRVAIPFVRLACGRRRVTVIPNATLGRDPVRFGNVSLAWCRAVLPLDTTHNALILRGEESGSTVMYCPHGLPPTGATFRAVERVLNGRLDALLCSFNTVDLPGYLGGTAGLGAEAGATLVARLAPRHVLPTHDGPKPDTGFIARRTTVTRCADVAGVLAGRANGTRAVVPRTGERWLPG